jgi:hypothetical protein
MTSHRHITTDHDEIRRWIQTHHGAPARKLTFTTTHPDGFLCIDFLGMHTPDLQHLSWTEWFTTFDKQGLALCYPDPHIHDGTSAWFELVHRSTSTPELR